MNGCTHFKCAGCDNIKPITEHHFAKTAYSVFDHTGFGKKQYEIHHVLLCIKCYHGIEAEVKEDTK